MFLQKVGSFPYQLLVLICSTHFFNNIFLASKVRTLTRPLTPTHFRVVRIIGMLVALEEPAAGVLFRQLIGNSFAERNLFQVSVRRARRQLTPPLQSLIKFYSDVEQTGAHNEFYGEPAARGF